MEMKGGTGVAKLREKLAMLDSPYSLIHPITLRVADDALEDEYRAQTAKHIFPYLKWLFTCLCAIRLYAYMWGSLAVMADIVFPLVEFSSAFMLGVTLLFHKPSSVHRYRTLYVLVHVVLLVETMTIEWVVNTRMEEQIANLTAYPTPYFPPSNTYSPTFSFPKSRPNRDAECASAEECHAYQLPELYSRVFPVPSTRPAHMISMVDYLAFGAYLYPATSFLPVVHIALTSMALPKAAVTAVLNYMFETAAGTCVGPASKASWSFTAAAYWCESGVEENFYGFLLSLSMSSLMVMYVTQRQGKKRFLMRKKLEILRDSSEAAILEARSLNRLLSMRMTTPEDQMDPIRLRMEEAMFKLKKMLK